MVMLVEWSMHALLFPLQGSSGPKQYPYSTFQCELQLRLGW